MKFIIYDTEITAWKGSLQRNWQEPWEAKEVIQFAANLAEINDKSLNILDAYNVYVQPRKNPTLSNYIIDLTGISQEQVDTGCSPTELFDYLKEITEEGDLPILSWGNDYHVLSETAKLNDINIDWLRSFNLMDVFKTCRIDTNINSGRLHTLFADNACIKEHNAIGDVESLKISLVELYKKHQEKVHDHFMKL